MLKIVAQLKPDWIQPYCQMGHYIPVVVDSNHPRYTVNKRFDWGFVKIALAEGYTVEIRPANV